MLVDLYEFILYWFRVCYQYVTGLFCGKTIHFDSGKRISIGPVLGEGAFSFVYKGHSCQSGEIFAIKKMYIQSEEIQTSAENEIAALKRFQHDHIIRLLDFSFQQEYGRGRVAYLLFPYSSGGSLRDILNAQISSGSMPRDRLGDTLKGFLDICKAINLMHTYSPPYVHRDIKPEVCLYVRCALCMLSWV